MNEAYRHQGLCIDGKYHPPGELMTSAKERLHDTAIQDWERRIWEFILEWYSASSHITQASSGTTGRRKEIMVPKTTMVLSAERTIAYLGLRGKDNALLVLPAEYIAGKMMIVRSIVGGLNLILAEPRATPDIDNVTNITFSAMVPMQVMNLLERKAFPGIDKLLIGGAEINESMIEGLSGVGTEAYATFGMAETASHIALRRINGAAPDPFYKALPGVSLRTDERGCLVIVADYLPAEVTTNDLVAMQGDGCFTWLGRYDNLLNSGGVKVIPEELESRLGQRTGCRVFLGGLPDKKLGHRLLVAVEGNPGAAQLGELKAGLKELLPAYLVPPQIHIVPRFPRNASFKIDRKRCMEMVKDSKVR